MRPLIIALLIILVWLYGVYVLHTSSVGAAYPTTCREFAIVLGKEGIVRDSLTMHLLGCTDNPRPTRYHADAIGEGCSTLARHYARSGYLNRPWTVSRMVQAKMPWCIVYEDGTYEDNSTH